MSPSAAATDPCMDWIPDFDKRSQLELVNESCGRGLGLPIGNTHEAYKHVVGWDSCLERSGRRGQGMLQIMTQRVMLADDPGMHRRRIRDTIAVTSAP